jgi:2-C-methyl-D-erythritol 4-phosphate cytidylyltransferase
VSFDREATDDASMVEASGGAIAIVEGDPMNLKVTYPEDLLLIEALRSGHHE